MSVYAKGALVRAEGVIYDNDRTSATFGQPIDPTTVKFRFNINAGAATEYTYPASPQLVKDATGRYHVDLSLDTAGTVKYHYVTSGTGQASMPDREITVVDVI